MKRQGVWLVAGFVALSVGACFSDPTDSLHNGPAQVAVSAKAITISSGESLAVQAVLKDEAGASLQATDVSWISADPTIAEVRVDTDKPAPGDIFSRAFIRGVTATGGVTSVTLVINGITDSVRVTVLPATFPAGGAAISGTPGTDTVTLNRASPLPPLVTIYNAGDTLVLTAPAGLTFAGNAGVTFGADPGMTVSNTGTVLKVMARAAFVGRPTVNNLVAAGSAQTGPITIASLRTADSIQIEHARFRGTRVVGNDPNFGANTLVTITAPAGMTFATGTSIAIGGVPAVGSTPTVAATVLIRLSQTATTMTAIAPTNQTGAISIRGALIGTAVIDSLRVGTAPVATTITGSAFPGTVATTGGTTNLLDTIVVSSGGGATFTAASSVVTIGGVPTLIVSRTAAQIKVIAGKAASGAFVITNVVVGGVTISSLQAATPVTVSGTVTGEANEPANNAIGAQSLTLGTAAAPTIRYGSISSAGDVDDYWGFTIAATTTVTLQVSFTGTGAGTDANGDIDFWVVNSTNTAVVSTFAGATGSQPENLVINNLPAGTYHIQINGYDTGGQNHSYRLSARGP